MQSKIYITLILKQSVQLNKQFIIIKWIITNTDPDDLQIVFSNGCFISSFFMKLYIYMLFAIIRQYFSDFLAISLDYCKIIYVYLLPGTLSAKCSLYWVLDLIGSLIISFCDKIYPNGKNPTKSRMYMNVFYNYY